MTRERVYVLDASAVLALLQGEPGAEQVRAVIRGARVSALNWSEILQKSASRGVDVLALRTRLLGLEIRVAPFESADAEATAELWSHGGEHLSLADRACRALAARFGATALTTDRQWRSVDLGVEVRLIR
jgi:PIN domain nuclease of toxin-antitoxin system